MSSFLGSHVTADIKLTGKFVCQTIADLCLLAIQNSNMQVVKHTSHKFKPQGLTAVWVLAESHFTLHTYPEHNYFSIDCYTCGKKGNPKAAITYLLSMLPVAKANMQVIKRGLV
jgi:S-adenosylmethionine decarboxylase